MPSAVQLQSLLCSLYYLCFIFIFKHGAIQLIWKSDKRHCDELKKKKWKESKSDTQKNKSTTKIKFQISDKEN